MADSVEDRIAELDAFEPSDDSIDNDERLQIWVDRWEETPDKEKAMEAMYRLFERNPECALLGEPGPLVHAIEQVPGYETELVASLNRCPSYYGVWMVNRILETDLPADLREQWVAVLRSVAESQIAASSVKATAQEFLAFQAG